MIFVEQPFEGDQEQAGLQRSPEFKESLLLGLDWELPFPLAFVQRCANSLTFIIAPDPDLDRKLFDSAYDSARVPLDPLQKSNFTVLESNLRVRSLSKPILFLSSVAFCSTIF